MALLFDYPNTKTDKPEKVPENIFGIIKTLFVINYLVRVF